MYYGVHVVLCGGSLPGGQAGEKPQKKRTAHLFSEVEHRFNHGCFTGLQETSSYCHYHGEKDYVSGVVQGDSAVEVVDEGTPGVSGPG